jgi:hypothetical protein
MTRVWRVGVPQGPSLTSVSTNRGAGPSLTVGLLFIFMNDISRLATNHL